MTRFLLLKRHKAFIIGIAFVLLGMGLIFVSSQSYAQGPEVADYIGTRACVGCHSDVGRTHEETAHAHTLEDVSRDKDAIVADFSVGEDVRMVLFPGEDEPRPFTPADITFTLGSGRVVQSYVYEVDRGEYRVFPAEWYVTEQRWEPFELADSWDDYAYDWGANCAYCHTTGYNADRVRWEDEGVQCEACHGPGSFHEEEADSAGRNPSDRELEDIREAIVLSPDAQICGQCHSRGVEPDENLPYPADYVVGETLLSTDIYNMPSVDDEVHWWRSGHAKLPNMQYNEWLTSGHARSLISLQEVEGADASCLACHSADYRLYQEKLAAYEAGEWQGDDPPEPLTVEAAENGVTCVACHAVHDADAVDTYLIDEPVSLCTSCHRRNEDLPDVHHPVQEMYEGLPIGLDLNGVVGVASSHFSSPDGPDCLTCHMPSVAIDHQGRISHTLDPIMPHEAEELLQDSCTNCHDDLSASYMSEFIDETQNHVRDRVTAARVAIGTRNGVDEWVHNALNFIENDGSWGVHNFAYTDALLSEVEAELGLVQINLSASPQPMDVADPEECAECHRDEFNSWQASYHANTATNNTFLEEYAAQGRPTYCMGCHASGYDPNTGNYAHEGVVCSMCHVETTNAQHPPAPVVATDASEVCAQCHSGAHSPTYNEWLASDHKTAGVDCVDCHTPHDNGLILGDVNSTCGDCHEGAMVDEVHMGDDMTCVDCHLTRRKTEDGVHVLETGHTMTAEAAVCSECHGNTHDLTVSESQRPPEEISEIVMLREEVDTLEEEADNNRNSGLIGGALGTLVVFAMAFFLFRMRKIL
jgi:predicted CXXCH cytochrome family protein